MNSVIKQTGKEGRRPFAVLALLSGLVLAIFASAAMPQTAAAGPTEYPVRLCSPNYPGQTGYNSTFNSGLGPVDVYHKASNGSVTYGKVGNINGGWTVWNPALRCGNSNTADGNGVGTHGIRFFDAANGVGTRFQEGGLEWTIPNDLSLRQVGMSGRALVNSGSPAQGGIGEGGVFLKFDFIGGESKKLKPATNYQQLVGFSANEVQNANKFRLGIICEPANGANSCFGAAGELALVNDLMFVMTDPTKPSISVNSSSIASGEWVKGAQTVTFTAQDTGSGLQETAVFIDDNQVSERTIPGCSVVPGTFAAGSSNLMMGRSLRPCPTTPQTETVNIDTTRFGDGLHTLKVCARDFAGASRMWNGDQKAAWTCSTGQEVKIDNTDPTAPEGAEAIATRIPRSVNPNDVTWTNPGIADNGSPIHSAVFSVVNQAGKEVVPPVTVNNGETNQRPANSEGANNIVHIPTLKTPADQGEFNLRIQLIDTVGHISKVSEVPLSYSCLDSGGTPLPQADIAMGIVEPQQGLELAKSFLPLEQGEQSEIVGKVRGPGQMPINGADVCINAKPVVDPQLQLLSNATTNANGNFESGLAPGPSRNLLTVFRQGHREVWSDQVSTEVTVEPTLSVTRKKDAGDYGKTITKAKVRTGQRLWFKGQIPGPYADKVVVVLQGKAAGTKAWRAFRRYRTRYDGKYVVPNRFYNRSTTGRKAKLLIRTQVRYTVGYPFKQGNSDLLKLTVLPKKKKKK